MTFIKILLLVAILAVGLLALRGSRKAYHKVMWRAYVVLVTLAAGLSVVFPNTLTRLANAIGVGRGADLVLYALVVTFMLVSVILFRRVAELERRYTTLARSIAVGGALSQDRTDEASDA